MEHLNITKQTEDSFVLASVKMVSVTKLQSQSLAHTCLPLIPANSDNFAINLQSTSNSFTNDPHHVTFLTAMMMILLMLFM